MNPITTVKDLTAADHDHDDSSVDAVAGSEFVDDRIRLESEPRSPMLSKAPDDVD